MNDLFDVSELRAIAKEVGHIVRPLGLNIMVLGRVALFYRYGFGGMSKDVDPRPHVDPLGERAQAEHSHDEQRDDPAGPS
jgi:hypothetical protein